MEGVIVTPLKKIIGEKGNVMHALKSSDAEFHSFGEAYFTTIEKGMIKGWKKHHKMILNLVVVSGKIRFVIFDDRAGSSSIGTYFEITLSSLDYYGRLTVHPGLWVAFEGLGEDQNILLNLASIEHDPAEAENCLTASGKIRFPIID